MKWLLLLALVVSQAHSATVCDPQKFEGQYGVQLTGTTTISGAVQPVASIGRLVFDGRGAVSGYVSVNFTGLLLGNPVTGTYQAGTDCSLTWKLQDDSGAYQNFAGTMTSDFLRVRFHQTDKGAARDGAMVRTPKECSAATLQKRYDYTIKGSTTATGMVELGDAGNLVINPAGGTSAGRGTVQVNGECIATFQLVLPGATGAMNLRGVVLDEAREILAIQTDPNTTVSARFTVR
jgi:hypothetical protein